MIGIALSSILLTITLAIIVYIEWPYTYWKRRNVPYLQPKFPFGNIQNPFTNKDHMGIQLMAMYNQFKSQGHKHGGFYFWTKPAYMPIDLEITKAILATDFEHFSNRGNYYNEERDPLAAHLFNLDAHKWRDIRPIVTPAFTPGRIRNMVEEMVDCADDMVATMKKMEKETGYVDSKSISSCFTTETVGRCGFGWKCNTFQNPTGDFRQFGEININFSSKWQIFKITISIISNKFARMLGITILNSKATRFLLDVVKRSVDFRKTQGTSRKDMLNMLMESNNLTLEQLAAVAFIFMIAGFEGGSGAISFCLYELALNPSIQVRLRNEINKILQQHDEKLTYDSVMEMKYLDQVVKETLRMYPIDNVLRRTCVKDYKIPDSDVTIEKDVTIFIPAIAIHRDPEFFSDPEKFDPERFNNRNMWEMNQFAYMPFGKGPRTCIGSSFALMQIKIAIATLLRNFSFSLNGKTKIPLEMSPFRLVLGSYHPIWLDIESTQATN